jgi:hypothetical protein
MGSGEPTPWKGTHIGSVPALAALVQKKGTAW